VFILLPAFTTLSIIACEGRNFQWVRTLRLLASPEKFLAWKDSLATSTDIFAQTISNEEKKSFIMLAPSRLPACCWRWWCWRCWPWCWRCWSWCCCWPLGFQWERRSSSATWPTLQMFSFSVRPKIKVIEIRNYHLCYSKITLWGSSWKES